MNPIDTVFQRLRAEGRKALIPFLTAGDPNLDATTTLVRELSKRGASLIEIGFPYSDPLADGPVIQASYTRALEKGIRVADILKCIREIGRNEGCGIPLVGMLSYSLVLPRGPEVFLQLAQDAGLSGAIVPDLPIEEADSFAEVAKRQDFKLIHLVTPTTPRARAVQIAKLSTGFLYYVSVAGITGERDKLPDDLLRELTWLRGQTDLPICVGFGISRPEQARMLRDVVDGIIVGSAFVRKLEGTVKRTLQEIAREIGELAMSLVHALNPTALEVPIHGREATQTH
jgi:tryptophan synthase alpha chain